MNKGPFVIFGAFAVICVVVIPYNALCEAGRRERGARSGRDLQDEDGKELFANNCGPCHTLAAAGTDGVVGPNLDQLLAPGGIGQLRGQLRPRAQRRSPAASANGRMPAGILQGENAKEVAAFVGAYAGQVGETRRTLVDTTIAEEPARRPIPAAGRRPSR